MPSFQKQTGVNYRGDPTYETVRYKKKSSSSTKKRRKPRRKARTDLEILAKRK